MKITIVGMGNAGTTVAADLSIKGNEVTLLKTSNKLHNENYENIKKYKKIEIEEYGKSKIAKINHVTTDFASALEGAELIILYVQTNYQKDVIKKMSPYLNEQMILVEPGYLSTIYFNRYCKDKNITIIEAESSPIDCRIIQPGKVKVLFRNVRNPIGVFPNYKKEKVILKLNELGYNFTPTKNIIEAALHNPNLIVHTIGAFMSIPRIEYVNGENYWMYREVFTESVWNIVKKLDCEKMNLMEAMGLKRIPYVDACKYRNSKDLNIDAEQVFFDYAKNSSPSGPNISNSRYITEDVPEGLILMESLGEHFGIQTPICTALINMSEAALNINFRKYGRMLCENDKKLLNEIIKDTI